VARNLIAHNRAGERRAKSGQPLHPTIGNKIVRFAGSIANRNGGSNGRESIVRGYLMTVGNQQIDAVAAATRAKHAAQFELYIVIHNVLTEFLGDPLDR
jgi:hypothetical protein